MVTSTDTTDTTGTRRVSDDDAAPLPRRAARRRAARVRAGWRGVAAVGAGLVLVLVAVVHAVVRAPIPPLLVFALVAAAILVLLARGPVRVAAGLALLLGVVLAPTDGSTAAGLMLYRDPYEFTLTVGGLVASFSLLVGGGVLMVRGRRAAGGTLPAALSAVAVLTVAAALCFSTIARITAPEVVAADGDVHVTTRDIAFQPAELRIPAGEVAFFVDNVDPVGHTFTVDGVGVDAAVAGGTAVRVTATVEPGEYRYVCSLEGHEAMEGTLVVE